MSSRTPPGKEQADHLDALTQATIFLRRGAYAQAIPHLEKALLQTPESLELLSALGLAYLKAGEAQKALEYFERRLALDAGDASTLNMAGALHSRAGNIARARELFEQSIAINPFAPEPFCSLGLMALAQGQSDEALEWFEKALSLDPGHTGSLRGLSQVLKEQGHEAEARETLRQLSLQTKALAAYHAGRCDPLLDHLRQQFFRHPNHPVVLMQLGQVLQAAGQPDESAEIFRRLVALEPENAIAHVHLAKSLLAAGHFVEGWKEYEWRITAGYFDPWGLPKTKARWNGAPMEPGRLLLLCEQGLGDAIQFARYLPLVMQRCGTPLKLVCWPSLARLFENAWPGQLALLSQWPPETEYDAYVSLMSLPHRLGPAPEAMPAPPYLKAAPDDLARWAQRIAPLPGRKIGIAWQGNPVHKEDRARSLTFGAIQRLLREKGCSFVSLQKDGAPTPEDIAGLEHFHDWTSELRDFADTAALISGLDLVISVDTAVAHLSGALGKTTWTLLPANSEWRWMRNTHQTPWYPSMRLIRQTRPGGWADVIGRVIRELRAFGED